MEPGFNNPGGPARVLGVDEATGSYSVKYIMGGRENGIEQAHVHSSNLLGFTASRQSAVQEDAGRKRTRPATQDTHVQPEPPVEAQMPSKPQLEKRRWRHAVRCTSREPSPYAKPPVAMPGGGGMRQGRHVWLLRRGVAFDTAWHRAEVVKWYGRRVRDTDHMYQVRFLSDGMKRLYNLAPWQRAFGDDEGGCTWGFPEDDSCYVRPAAEAQEDEEQEEDDDDDDDADEDEEESDESGGGGRSSGETLDWVQCSACSKWRTLRAGMVRALSDKAWEGTDFTCAMNSWHPHLASCDALEEEVEIDEAVECTPAAKSPTQPLSPPPTAEEQEQEQEQEAAEDEEEAAEDEDQEQEHEMVAAEQAQSSGDPTALPTRPMPPSDTADSVQEHEQEQEQEQQGAKRTIADPSPASASVLDPVAKKLRPLRATSPISGSAPDEEEVSDATVQPGANGSVDEDDAAESGGNAADCSDGGDAGSGKPPAPKRKRPPTKSKKKANKAKKADPVVFEQQLDVGQRVRIEDSGSGVAGTITGFDPTDGQYEVCFDHEDGKPKDSTRRENREWTGQPLVLWIPPVQLISENDDGNTAEQSVATAGAPME